MLTKRIIPCLDVDKGRVVKGINFINLREVGDPADLAMNYSSKGADELAFLDITASVQQRQIMLDVVKKVAKKVFIPFTVGGGIRSPEDIRNILLAGADKVSLNTAAVKNPKLISQAANKFGSQCIILAIDTRKTSTGWEVFTCGGRIPTGIDAVSWAKRGESLGAGEILLTSMDADGTKKGFDIELTRRISVSLNIPVIASGGAGTPRHFAEVFVKGKADAALAASLFHYKKLTIYAVKNYLKKNNILVRE